MIPGRNRSGNFRQDENEISENGDNQEDQNGEERGIVEEGCVSGLVNGGRNRGIVESGIDGDAGCEPGKVKFAMGDCRQIAGPDFLEIADDFFAGSIAMSAITSHHHFDDFRDAG